MTTIKVCGITRLEDALVAAEAGADGIGFVFAPSPRQVDPDRAYQIARRLPPLVARVGVFVDAPVDTMVDIVRHVGLDVVQLHGDEGPEVAERLRQLAGCRIVKAFRVKGPADLAAVTGMGWDAVLLDTYHPALAGGTGQAFDWSWWAGLPGREALGGVARWLAGGLQPGNIRTALLQARPDGVDVSSGVEAAPGRKDPGLVRRFIQEVRRFDLAEATGGP